MAATAAQQIAGLEAAVQMPSNGHGIGLQVDGTWTGTIAFEGTNDGTTWVAVAGYDMTTGATATTTTANGVWAIPATFDQVRARLSAYAAGTAEVYFVKA